MRNLFHYSLLLLIEIAALWFGFSDAHHTGHMIVFSPLHFVPALIATFPLGTAGLGLWLFHPLNSGFGIVAILTLLLNPPLQLILWDSIAARLSRRHRQSDL